MKALQSDPHEAHYGGELTFRGRRVLMRGVAEEDRASTVEDSCNSQTKSSHAA